MIKWSIRKKLILISLLFLSIPSIIIGFTGYYLEKKTLDELGTIRLQNSVQMAIELIDAMDKQVKAGKMTLGEAQEEVKIHLLGERKPDGTRPINTKVNLGKNGYFVVYDLQGNEVAHPNLEGKNVIDIQDPKTGTKFMREIIDRVKKDGSTFYYYNWKLPSSETITTKVTFSQLDPHWGWIVSAGSYLQDYNGNAEEILYILLMILGASFLLGGWAIFGFANHLARPIIHIAEQTGQVAQGNLSVQPIVVKNEDEVGQLARNFGEMIHQMRIMVTQVQTSSEQVAASAEQLTAGAEQSNRAIEQITNTIHEVAAANDKQFHSVKSSSQAIHEMSVSADHIAGSVQSVSTTAEQTSQKALEGTQAIQSAIHQMNSVHHTFDQLSAVVGGLGNRSGEIGQIIEVITGIASQTNLLALNAAIEASRAGEQGRGFAVVADEVRKLAEQSSQSAQRVAELISSIQEETDKAVQLMDAATQEVGKGMGLVNGAGETFQQIRTSVSAVASQVREVTQAVKQMSAGTEQLNHSTRYITQIAEETALGTQHVSSATEEHLASTEEITASASSVAKMAEELQVLIQKFKV